MKNCSGAFEGNFSILLNIITELVAFIGVISKACLHRVCVNIRTKDRTNLQRPFLRAVWTKKRLNNNVAKTLQFSKSSVKNR